MAKNRKVNTLDGYATLKAVARSGKGHEKPDAAEPALLAPSTSAPQHSEAPKAGTHIARTVMPAKRVIECYECGYKFQLHGRAPNTNCSKCRTNLDLTDHKIESEWSKTLKTAGTIRLTAGGILKGAELVGNDIVLEGIVEAGSVRAMRRLELGEGAVFSEKAISASDLRIAPGAAISFKQEAKYRDVEVLGTLNARLEARGIVTIKAGGLLAGEVRADHLVVEDGGGLKATLRIGHGVEPSLEE